MKTKNLTFKAKILVTWSLSLCFILSCQKAKELDSLSVKSQIQTVPRLDITVLNYCLPSNKKKADFYVFNRNIRMEVSGSVVDSDGDGLVDVLEQKVQQFYNLDLFKIDTNGDFYDDLVTFKSGLSQVELGALPIANDLDDDQDTLNNISENLIGTEFRKADTDNDTIPDGVELFFGLNPLIPDADVDADSDGLTNLEEIKRGMPLFENQKLNKELSLFNIDIKVEAQASSDPAEDCFKYSVKNVAINPNIESNTIEFVFAENVNNQLSFVIKRIDAYLSQLALSNTKETRYLLMLDYKNGLTIVTDDQP
jgi:hypothetical protein